jgi:hypothetical protein
MLQQCWTMLARGLPTAWQITYGLGLGLGDGGRGLGLGGGGAALGLGYVIPCSRHQSMRHCKWNQATQLWQQLLRLVQSRDESPEVVWHNL